jgi:hypothetical protein
LNNIKQQVEYPQEYAKGAEHPGHFIRSLFGIRGGQYQCLDAENNYIHVHEKIIVS